MKDFVPSRTHVPYLVSRGRVECNAEVIIGAAVQTVGVGLSDLTPAGTYLGPTTATYTFKISTAAGVDKFQWKKDAGDYSAEIAMTGAAQVVELGLTALWAATTGHTLNDTFTVAVTVKSAFIAYDKAGSVLLEIKNDGTATIPGLLDPLLYKGIIDCSGSPNYPAADAGHIYIVSVAGKVGGASGDTVEVGDLLLCKTDGSASGTKAAVGANWNILQTSLNPTDFVTHALATAANDSLWASGAGAFVKKTLPETQVILGTKTVAPYTDGPVNLVVGDAGKTITMTSADAEIINLPSVAAAQIGMELTIVKLGAGTVTIQAADADIIASSAAGGTLYNNQAAETYATVTLRLVSATQWMIVGMLGTWLTT